MVIGGLGLGFVLPNLTIFAQQTAGREHLGIATALLQSLRMIGGMIGTAITGTLITHMYASGVRKRARARQRGALVRRSRRSAILINHAAQASLLDQLERAGHHGTMLLEAARHALVDAIHVGLALAALVAVVSVWQAGACRPSS